MNIILVSENLATARTIHFSGLHIVLLAAAFFLAAFALAALLNILALRHAAEVKSPLLKSLIAPFLQERLQEKSQRSESYLRGQLSAMAAKVGQMQAQLLRLDVLGERLARIGGFRPQEFLFGQQLGQGGAPSSIAAESMSMHEIDRQLEVLSRQVEDRSDQLGFLESLFGFSRAKQQLIPSVMPIDGGLYTSNFGWRIDPFNGTKAYHEGVDFLAEQGTSILAAAGGVVVYAEYHPQYGNMVDIDHGNGFVTRYAHARKLKVKVGDVVQRGAKIGDVGMTGRATGPHLHFEVRENGIAQHPSRFLQMPG